MQADSLPWGALNPLTGILTRRGDETQREAKREEGHVKTEAETRGVLPKFKEHQGLLAIVN